MTDGVDIDFSEFDTLAAQLGEAPVVAGHYIRSAIEISARHVKDKWAEKLSGENGVPHAARSITYDISVFQGFGVSVIEAEIGSERGRLQAPIVTVLEFGAPGQNLAPRGYGHGALQETEADFEKGLGKAIQDATDDALRQSTTLGIFRNLMNRGGG